MAQVQILCTPLPPPPPRQGPDDDFWDVLKTSTASHALAILDPAPNQTLQHLARSNSRCLHCNFGSRSDNVLNKCMWQPSPGTPPHPFREGKT